MVVAVVVVVAAVVVLLVVEESHGSMFGLKIAHFCHFAKRRNGRTYGHTDGEMDRPSYRDTRTHQKSRTNGLMDGWAGTVTYKSCGMCIKKDLFTKKILFSS